MGKKNFSSKIDDDQIQKLCRSLLESQEVEKSNQKYAQAKRILTYLGTGMLIATAFLSPRSGKVIKSILFDEMRQSEIDEWRKYNTGYLKQTLKRFTNEKLVEIIEKNGQEVIQISQNGIIKILKFSFDKISLKTKKWDGKWRLIIYDIESTKKDAQQLVRSIFKRLGFYPMQKSVYLYPYDCYEAVEYIRSYYGINLEIKYIVAFSIENDKAYRIYFNI